MDVIESILASIGLLSVIGAVYLWYSCDKQDDFDAMVGGGS